MGKIDGQYIDSKWKLMKISLLQKKLADFVDAFHFFAGDGLGSIAVAVAGAGFDFGEHDRFAVARDQIDFTQTGPEVSFEDLISLVL